MLLIALLTAQEGSAARADGPCIGRWWPFRDGGGIHSMVRCWCPDDYCPKQLSPTPCGPSCWLPDDYCPKKLPCPPRRPTCGPDDYVPKCCPILVGVGCGPNYTCGPACRSEAANRK
jgi:hypothetical protein